MSLLILPGLIDPHVHLRDPGQTDKEDFFTGTSAALAGGYTAILDMPNNKTPITALKRLDEKIKIAKRKIVADCGFYFGSLGDNLEEFPKVISKVSGLKLYLSFTTGGFVIPQEKVEKVFKAWSQNFSFRPLGLMHEKPLLVHAEDKMLDIVIKLAKKIGNKIHVCHISTVSDLKQIIKAKQQGLKITCGVTPHHLFLTENDVKQLDAFGKMKPPLQNKKDQDFLWKNLKFIDVIESDHAPHTVKEKIGEGWRDWKERTKEFACLTGVNSRRATAGSLRPRTSNGTKERQVPEHKTPFGVPGLETTLPLLLTAVSEKKLSIKDIIRLCHTNPAKIFNIKTDPKTKIEVNLNSSFIIHNSSLFTKCGWSPFDGWKVKGKVQRVFIRGTKVFENGKVLVNPGFGKIISLKNYLFPE